MKNIIIFKINKNLDFQNHLIGMDVYRRRHKLNLDAVEYYRKLEKANEKERFGIFEKKTKRFYDPARKKFRELILSQTQQTWNIIECEYIQKIEKVHHKEFPYKEVYGIVTTASRYGYNFEGNKKWFACSNNSPLHSIDIAMHEIMHLIFHKYFFNQWKEKFSLSNEQMWTIKESFTILLNSECSDIMFNLDIGYPEHKEIRTRIEKHWKKNKDFEKILDEICEYVKTSKLFLK